MMNNIEQALKLVQQEDVILGYEEMGGFIFFELPIVSTPYSMLEMLIDTSHETCYIVGHSKDFLLGDEKKKPKYAMEAFIMANNINGDMLEKHQTGAWVLNYSPSADSEAPSGSFTYSVGFPRELSAESIAGLLKLAVDSYSATRGPLNRFCYMVNTGKDIDLDLLTFSNEEIEVTLHPAIEKIFESFTLTEDDLFEEEGI